MATYTQRSLGPILQAQRAGGMKHTHTSTDFQANTKGVGVRGVQLGARHVPGRRSRPLFSAMAAVAAAAASTSTRPAAMAPSAATGKRRTNSSCFLVLLHLVAVRAGGCAVCAGHGVCAEAADLAGMACPAPWHRARCNGLQCPGSLLSCLFVLF